MSNHRWHLDYYVLFCHDPLSHLAIDTSSCVIMNEVVDESQQNVPDSIIF